MNEFCFAQRALGHHEANEADRRGLQVLAAPLSGGHHEGTFSDE